MRRSSRIAIVIAAVGVVLAGITAGRLVWRRHVAEAFGASYNPLNDHYKQVLFLTGQGQREPAIQAYEGFVAALAAMRQASDSGRLTGDPRLSPALEQVFAVAQRARPLVLVGDLHQAHVALEAIRPILTDVLRRNGLSALKVALVDFHDQLERVVEAGTARNAPAALAELPAADAKLRTIEQELDDARVRAIRAALDRVRALAEAGMVEELPGASGALKAAFVKVYLAEG